MQKITSKDNCKKKTNILREFQIKMFNKSKNLNLKLKNRRKLAKDIKIHLLSQLEEM